MEIECVMFDWMRTCVILNVCDMPQSSTAVPELKHAKGRQSPNAQALRLKR